jgi:hypothetical protein
VTATVVGFVGARRRAFAYELRRINAEFRKRRARVRALSVNRFWFEEDPAYALAQTQGEVLHDCILSRLQQCVAAARRYGADPAPFEKALKRWTPENAA